MSKNRFFKMASGLLCVLAGVAAGAETMVLQPVADTSLHEIFPENNFGAFPFFHGGVSGKGTRTRGLLRFELAGVVPEGAEVTSATLAVEVVYAAPKTPVVEEAFGVHRMLTPWGEGRKDDSAGMGGRLAGDGEASWRYARKPEEWSVSGGEPGVDYALNESAVAAVGDVGMYLFDSTAELVADVQAWIDQPEGNFGWMIRSVGETVEQSAKRFGSRESESPALLTIDYQVAPAAVVITSIRVQGEEVVIEWTGGSGPYQLERRTAVEDGTWVVEQAGIEEQQAGAAAGDGQSFFRIRAGE